MIARQIPKPLRVGRSENRDRERGFEPHGRRQQFSPDTDHRRYRQRPVMARSQPSQDLRLAPWLIKGDIVAFLGGRDLRNNFRPRDQQIVHPVIDLVDVTA